MTSPVDLPTLQQQLLSGDPAAAMAAATAAAAAVITPSQSATLTMYNPFYTEALGQISDHIELKLNDPRQALPAGSLTLKGTDPLADIAVTCDTTLVPIIYDKLDGSYRWSGRIMVAHDGQKFRQAPTVECELVGDKHWLDHIMCWPAPLLPVWLQEPAEWWGLGPAVTVINTLIMEQAFRIQSGIWTILNDIGSLDFNFQIFAQQVLTGVSLLFSPDELLQVLHTPITVVPVNPFFDTSPWIEINGRMDSVWKLIQQQLLDNGLDISVTMWLPGEPQPPNLAFPITGPTVVVQVLNRSGITGPSGTILDGAIIDAVQFGGLGIGGLAGDALQSLLNPGDSQPYVETDLGEFIAPAIGVNFETPFVIFDLDTPNTGVIEHNVSHHHPLAWQVVVGGQSPQWINDLLNSLFEWLVDSIMLILGFTGLPSDILDGLLDNVLFAFSTVQNAQTKAISPFMFPEKFFPAGQGTLSMDALFAEAAALWNVRGYPSGTISWLDGYPYTVGKDVFRSMLVLYIKRSQVYVDYVENIEIVDNRTSFNKVTIQIGDGKSEESGAVKLQRKMVDFSTAVNIVLSGGNPSS
jgi:hypothetical protein